MMQKMMCKCPWGMTMLRVVVGIVFLAHGIQKLQNMEGVVGFFASLGFGAFFAYLVAWVETLAGIMLIVGFLTTIAAYAVAIIMIVAMITVKIKMGFLGGYELDLTLLAAALALAWGNASNMSLGKMMAMKCGCGKCPVCMDANGGSGCEGGTCSSCSTCKGECHGDNACKNCEGCNNCKACDGCEGCKDKCSGHEMMK